MLVIAILTLAAPAATTATGPEILENRIPPVAEVGAPYSLSFESGLEPPPTFSAVGDLPAGMKFDPTGLLSGVPTSTGRSAFDVYAQNGIGYGTQQRVILDVVAPPKVQLEAADSVGPTSAHLSGTVDTGNRNTDVWFEFWPSEGGQPGFAGYRTVTATTGTVAISATAEGLTPGISYSYRMGASSEQAPNSVFTGSSTLVTPLPPPEEGQSFNIEPVEGKVSTRCGQEQSFTRLRRPRQVSLDCQIDADEGTVSVTASKGSSGQTQTANFWGGLFDIDQEAGDERPAVVSLAGKRRCERRLESAGGNRKLVRARGGGGSGRHLWGSGKGNYKTVGSHGSATVRGTTWYVQDRCDGSTFFAVKTGTVWVRDFVKQTTVVLEAGQSYVVRTPFDRLP